MKVFIGCAGWNLPKASQDQFSVTGTHLTRYASRLNAVEINSSFYRAHQPKTYARWADSVPPDFRFAVKAPKRITHELRLGACDAELTLFLEQASGLGDKLRTVLVQLPPSLAFDAATVQRFLDGLRSQWSRPVTWEPRHPSWFTAAATRLLEQHDVSRVAADPPPRNGLCEPGGCGTFIYYRLHGSPQIYYSRYPTPFLRDLAVRLRDHLQRGCEVWCIFDNTALGWAIVNALELSELLPLGAG